MRLRRLTDEGVRRFSDYLDALKSEPASPPLYVDPATKEPKRGAGGKTRGTARRLADFCNQIDITWDLYAMEAGEVLAKLPKEFQRFQPD